MEFAGPNPSPGFEQQVAASIEIPLTYHISGETTASKNGVPIGAPRKAGRIDNAYLSVGASGKDDSNTLSIEADVLVNGTTCLTTKPKIAHVSGEASTNKTTKEVGDTGITQAVMASDNDYSPGDSITANFTMTRTATPTTVMANISLVVELRPS